jgi:hypothetical protein
MKACIAKLLSSFEFTLQQDPASVNYDSSLTLPMKGGIQLAATPLKLVEQDLQLNQQPAIQS